MVMLRRLQIFKVTMFSLALVASLLCRTVTTGAVSAAGDLDSTFGSGGNLAYATPAPIWLGGEGLKSSCPASCPLSSLRILDAINVGRREGGGHDIKVRWIIDAIPFDIQVNSFSINVEVKLLLGRIQSGDA